MKPAWEGQQLLALEYCATLTGLRVTINARTMGMPPITWLKEKQRGCSVIKAIAVQITSITSLMTAWVSASTSGSGKYFPDWHGDNEACLQDTGSTRAPDYMQDSTTWLFDDLESCCDQHYSYAKSSCMGSSASSGTLNGS